ncbi:MAG: ABC transporter ATP-binding protein [Candidatus Bathyarchaeia archaeon]
MLRVEELNAGYERLQVLFDVQMKVFDRKVTILVGPNGSGKSTLLKAILGLTKVYSGKILLDNLDITFIPPHQKAKMGIAYLPQVENIFANLTVEENLKMAGYILDESSYLDGLEMALGTFPELKAFMKRKAGTLSGGERQFLAIATALVRKAKLLMLDEPTAQLSPKLVDSMFNRIASLRDELGLTIVLVEQNIRKALEIGDNAYLLISGKLAFQGSAQELLKHESFEKLCMGIC